MSSHCIPDCYAQATDSAQGVLGSSGTGWLLSDSPSDLRLAASPSFVLLMHASVSFVQCIYLASCQARLAVQLLLFPLAHSQLACCTVSSHTSFLASRSHKRRNTSRAACRLLPIAVVVTHRCDVVRASLPGFLCPPKKARLKSPHKD